MMTDKGKPANRNHELAIHDGSTPTYWDAPMSDTRIHAHRKGKKLVVGDSRGSQFCSYLESYCMSKRAKLDTGSGAHGFGSSTEVEVLWRYCSPIQMVNVFRGYTR